MQANEIAAKPEVQALVADVDTLADDAAGLAIIDATGYEVAVADLKRTKDALDKLVALRKSFTDPLDVARKAVMDWFRSPEAKLRSTESTIKAGMIRYDEEQEARRREAQRKLDEQAAKERAKLEEQARKAAASGKTGKADTLNERASMVVAPIVVAERPAVSGISTRENWRAEVDDLETLVRAVATGLAPRACLKPDEAFLNRQARALKSEFNYPGVRAVSERGIAARRS